MFLIGGSDGHRGKNILVKTDGSEIDLGSKASVDVKPGVRHLSLFLLFLFLF